MIANGVSMIVIGLVCGALGWEFRPIPYGIGITIVAVLEKLCAHH